MKLASICLLVLTGCSQTPAIRPVVVSAPIVAGQEGKDATVLAEALKIDSIAPFARVHTNAQRAAVVAAPAADVSKLVKALEAQSSQLQQEITKLTKERDDARGQTDRVIVIGGYALAALFVSAGVATFFLMAQLPFLGPKIGFALIGAGSSVFVLLQAYQWTKAHPWATGITLLFLVAAGVLAIANQLRAKKEVGYNGQN